MNCEIRLDGRWSFAQSGRRSGTKKTWLPACVPGTVHTDLLATGRVEDPFYRRNELEHRWIEETDWLYRRIFEVPDAFRSMASRIYLDFEGLDTFTTIRLNGIKIGHTDNMFHPWRFEVSKFLKGGGNVLEIEFFSAANKAQKLAAVSKIQYKSSFFEPRIFIRKAQYSGGWDWGPRLMTCGVWRPVRLLGMVAAEIRHVYPRVTQLSEREAVVDIEVEVNSVKSGPAILRLELTEPSGRIFCGTIPVRVKPGTSVLHGRLVVDRPRLWWPLGAGDQPLYELRTEFEMGGEILDRRQDRTGLRTVELIRRKDKQGESFIFRINGRDIFCKGANWVPPDSFLPRFTPDQYRRRVADARDANMNMLRVWGGGIYEDRAFYEACDEMGIMVWQDFMFACAEYPEDKTFLAGIGREAESVVRRLRHHPCLVLWCGNNENHWGFDEWWPPRPKRYGEVIYDRILPKVCRTLDPSRPYWPGSPYGGPTANHPDYGDRHEWTVWIFWQNPEKYRESRARFVSEFGFQAMPDVRTVREYTKAEDRWLFSPVIDHHNKCDDGHPRNLKFIAGGYGLPRDLDDYIYLSQVVQAEAIKMGVEHWRRRWPATGGALYWQHNDCWPVASWSAVDSAGRPKGLWYASRRFFAPVLVSLCPAGKEAYGKIDLEVWACHDGMRPRPAKVEVAAWTVDGKCTCRKTRSVQLPANGSRHLDTIEYKSLGLPCPERGMIHLRLTSGRELLSENTYFFSLARHTEWMDPGLKLKVFRQIGGMRIDISVRRPARAVYLAVDAYEGRFSDNWFDLFPGQRKTIFWMSTGNCPAEKAFRKALKGRSLFDGRKARSGR